MTAKPYERDTDGMRLQFRGMNVVLPPDRMPEGKFPYAQNVRAYLRDRIIGRATQDVAVETLGNAVHSLRRLNDSTPAGPISGFILVGGAGNVLYANTTVVDSGLSGNPISLLPFRPNASVQPWMYVGDSFKMDKVRSDGTCYKMGIAEPQVAPIVNPTAVSNVLGTIGPVTVQYWGDSPHGGGASAYLWKNNTDKSGSGPIRTAVAAAGSTTGTSLLFDTTPGSPATPMQWITYTANIGTVNTLGTAVTWVSGSQFGNLTPGQSLTIGTVLYLIQSVTSNTALVLQTSAGTQNGVNYSGEAITGTTPVFQPALKNWRVRFRSSYLGLTI